MRWPAVVPQSRWIELRVRIAQGPIRGAEATARAVVEVGAAVGDAEAIAIVVGGEMLLVTVSSPPKFSRPPPEPQVRASARRSGCCPSATRADDLLEPLIMPNMLNTSRTEVSTWQYYNHTELLLNHLNTKVFKICRGYCQNT